MKKIKNLILSLSILLLLFGCNNQDKQNFVSLINQNQPDYLPHYKIKVSNVETLKIRMSNNQNENFPLYLSGVSYQDNLIDNGSITFKEFKNNHSNNSIIVIYDTIEIDSHSDLMITELNIDITDYKITNLNNKIDIDKNDSILLFSIDCHSQIYDIYLDVTFH